MVYAKIDQNENVIKFPYYFRSLDHSRQPLPDDVVPVDVTANKPTIKWDQKVTYAGVTKINNRYVVEYNPPESKFNNFEQRKKNIIDLKKMYQQINERTFTAKVKELKRSYLDSESESWPIQRSEALAYSSDSTTNTPLLTAIADARKITVSELTDKILKNTAYYDTAYGMLLGTYQKNKKILDSIDLNDETTWDLIDTVKRL